MTTTRAPGANDRSSASRRIVFSPATRTRHGLERQPFPAQPAGSRRGRRAAAWPLSTRATVLPHILSRASDGQRPGRMRSLEASSPTRGKARRGGHAARRQRPRPRSPLGGNAARYDQVVAQTANTANTVAARRSAAAQQLRGTFADTARDPKLVDELIGERRAEALAEDRAADAPPRPGG